MERYNQATRRRIDVFGFGDVLVLDGQLGALLIQACITSDMSTREKKIRGPCASDAMSWIVAGNRIAVWGWAKRGAAGKRKLWTLKERQVVFDVR